MHANRSRVGALNLEAEVINQISRLSSRPLVTIMLRALTLVALVGVAAAAGGCASYPDAAGKKQTCSGILPKCTVLTTKYTGAYTATVAVTTCAPTCVAGTAAGATITSPQGEVKQEVTTSCIAAADCEVGKSTCSSASMMSVSFIAVFAALFAFFQM